MNYEELINKTAKKAGVNKTAAKSTLDAFKHVIRTMKSGDSFQIPGLMTVTASTRKAKMFRNPATGGQVPSPEKRVIKVKLSKLV